MPPLLALDGISAAYGQSPVLFDLSLAIEPAAAVALLGRNGVGKSTLLRTIVGLHAPSAGRIALGGADVTRMKAHERARRGIGYVPQGRNIFPHLSVEENLRVGLSALAGRKDAPEPVIPDYVYEIFPKLADLKARKGGVLSGGEQQQLAIGRALAGRPSLMLLDEPTEGIQPSVVQQIEAALGRIRRELGIAVLIVEQYLDFAWSFAQSYYVMQKGRVIAEGRTADAPASSVAHLVNI